MKPRIALTMGDPAGIGPEILCKFLRNPHNRKGLDFLVIGSRRYLRKTHQKFFPQQSSAYLNKLSFIDFDYSHFNRLSFGVVDGNNGFFSGLFIKKGIELALDREVDALVTCPIHKEAFRKGGWGRKFTGHTEMLKSLSGAKHVAMMMVSGSLRAVHVTSHVSLKKVPSLIKKKRIQETIALTEVGLKALGIRRPKIAVCGLNPHSGENGLLGGEEKKEILPAIRTLKRKGVLVYGPFSSDVLWPRVQAGHFEAGVAMYHDQGQIPIKMRGFSFGPNRGSSEVSGVNVTLGIPFIRTSVDHGTSFDIAGKGVASEKSLKDAVLLASQMVRSRKG